MDDPLSLLLRIANSRYHHAAGWFGRCTLQVSWSFEQVLETIEAGFVLSPQRAQTRGARSGSESVLVSSIGGAV